MLAAIRQARFCASGLTILKAFWLYCLEEKERDELVMNYEI